MSNLITGAVGGYMAAKMDPKSTVDSVISAFWESRVVSTALELVATLYGSSVSSLPFPISYTITYLPMVLFGIGQSGQIAKESDSRKVFDIFKDSYKQVIKTTVFSLAFFGVLFGKHAKMTSMVTLVTYSFFSILGTDGGKRIIKEYTGLNDAQIKKIESTSVLAANVGMVFANSSWIFKAHGVLRALPYFDMATSNQMFKWYDQGVKWVEDRITNVTGSNPEWLTHYAATLKELLTGGQGVVERDSSAAELSDDRAIS